MSRNIDVALEHLDRYEARLYATKSQLIKQVEQQFGVLKQKVAKIRNRLLRSRISQHANNSLSFGSIVNYQNNLATKSANQGSSTTPVDVSVIPSTSRKRSRGQATRPHSTRRPKAKDRTEIANEDNINEKGWCKINTIRLNCT